MPNAAGVTSTSAALSLALTPQAGANVPAALAAKITGAALTAPIATGALAVAINFMSTAKMMTTASVVVALSAIGFSLAQRTRLQAVEQDRALLTQRLAQAEQRLQQFGSSTPAIPAVVSASLAPSASTDALPAPAASAAPAPGATLEEVQAALANVVTAGSRVLSLNAAHIAGLRAWADRDPSGLIQWISTLPDPKRREHALEAVIYVEMERHPEFAFLVTHAIEDDRPRRNRRHTIVRSWVERDIDAAAHAIATTDMTDAERKSLNTLVSVEKTRRQQR